MSPRIFAFVVLLGAVAAVLGAPIAPQALAATAEVKLQVNQNCVELNWPCWTVEPSSVYPHPASKVTIAHGGEVEFVEQDPSTAAGVNWIGAAPMCTGVPTTATLNWEGSCKFEQAGLYRFESSTMFEDAYENYKKYEIAVRGIPKVSPLKASLETQTEATLNGSIGPEGNTVEYHFEYEGPGVTGKPSTPTSTLSAADFASHSVSAQVTGLQPGSTYHFQLVATYGASKTTVSGATEQFTTKAVTAPVAAALAAEAVKETEATLKGAVNPGGEATEYFFEYGTDTHYGQKTNMAILSASAGNQVVSATLKGLTPDTEYHFRLVAKNKQGLAEGLDGSFKTMSPPAKEPSPTSTPPPTVAPTPGPIAPEPELAPLVPPLVQSSLKLTAPRHGSSVHGSLDVSQAGAGGRLEVDLIANSASLARRGQRARQVVVGRLVRASVPAGRVSFSVALNARGRSALRRRHRLALAVEVTLAPPMGKTEQLRSGVILRA